MAHESPLTFAGLEHHMRALRLADRQRAALPDFALPAEPAAYTTVQKGYFPSGLLGPKEEEQLSSLVLCGLARNVSMSFSVTGWDEVVIQAVMQVPDRNTGELVPVMCQEITSLHHLIALGPAACARLALQRLYLHEVDEGIALQSGGGLFRPFDPHR